MSQNTIINPVKAVRTSSFPQDHISTWQFLTEDYLYWRLASVTLRYMEHWDTVSRSPWWPSLGTSSHWGPLWSQSGQNPGRCSPAPGMRFPADGIREFICELTYCQKKLMKSLTLTWTSGWSPRRKRVQDVAVLTVSWPCGTWKYVRTKCVSCSVCDFWSVIMNIVKYTNAVSGWFMMHEY